MLWCLLPSQPGHIVAICVTHWYCGCEGSSDAVAAAWKVLNLCCVKSRASRDNSLMKSFYNKALDWKQLSPCEIMTAHHSSSGRSLYALVSHSFSFLPVVPLITWPSLYICCLISCTYAAADAWAAWALVHMLLMLRPGCRSREFTFDFVHSPYMNCGTADTGSERERERALRNWFHFSSAKQCKESWESKGTGLLPDECFHIHKSKP